MKTFGRTRALDGLDLTVATARCTASSARTAPARRPPSGSCSGLLRADAGTARLLGGDPWRDASELHRRLAYVPGDVTLWPNLSGGEVIDLLGRLRGGLDPRGGRELLERFELDPPKKGRAYSKGNRQKVALVAAFASDVELLILDEPTSGLDPLMEDVFREVRREELRRAGRTVLLSSHILSRGRGAVRPGHASSATGRTVETGTLAELRHLTRRRRRRTGRAADRTGRPARRARPATVDGNRVSFEVDTDAARQRAALADRARRARADQPAAHAGGAVPAPLPGRGGPADGDHDGCFAVRGRRHASLTGTGAGPSDPAPGPDRAPVWVLVVAAVAVSSSVLTSTLYRRPAARRSGRRGRAHDPSSVASTGQLSAIASARWWPGALRCLAVLAGADQPAHRHPAHPRGGGERAAGTASAQARRRHAALTSALLVAVGANALVAGAAAGSRY